MPIFRLNDKFITKSSNNRIYKLNIPVIGLTGGIATGKSTASAILKELGLCVIDADKLVKKIYNQDEALKFIKSLSPKCISPDNSIDFRSLREVFFEDEQIKEKIEAFIYPRLRAEFLKEIDEHKPELIIYDAPVLFERGLDKLVDQTLLIYAPREVQLSRLLKRDQIDRNLAQSILSNQDSIEDKKLKSNHVINNIGDLDSLRESLDKLVKKITV